MSKLAIIDLDGVICDNTKRFEKAEEAKQNALNAGWLEKSAERVYWNVAFTPELVPLDTLIPGVPEALNTLYSEYAVIFLTSRPESMRGATEAWLEEHDISVEHPQFGGSLVMKQPAFQFTKTVIWKVGMVQMLHKLFNADTVVFVDDDEANRTAVLDAYPDGGEFGIVHVVASLDEAVKLVERSNE